MSQALRQLIQELRDGADLSPEGATSIQWRERIHKLAMPSATHNGLGVAMIATAARNLLLQRGQMSQPSDTALCGVLVEMANILEMELTALDERGANRAVSRRGIPWYLRDSA